MNILKNLYDHFTIQLGVGTIVGAFCLGPLINFFNKYNRKWIVDQILHMGWKLLYQFP